MDRLLVGDNLRAMDALADELAGQVQLIYADPPFASGIDYYRAVRLDGRLDGPGDFEIRQYGDRWERGEYLQFLAERLERVRDLLAPTGVLFLHLGGPAAAHVRVLCDAIFGTERLLNEVAWVRQTAHSDRRQGARHLGRIHDTILIYGKSARAGLRPLYQPYEKDYVDRFYRHVEEDTGRRYMLDNLVAPGGAAKGNPQYEVLGVTRHWRYSRERMDDLVAAGRVVQTAPGRVPRYVRYLDEMPGRPLQDVWTDVRPVQVHAKERAGFPTQKPLALLDRIVELGSDEGDLVLDPFLGSGTTAVAARRLGRRWVGIEAAVGNAWLAVRRLCSEEGRGFTLGAESEHHLWRPAKEARLEVAAEDDGLRLEQFAPPELLEALGDPPEDWRALVDQVHSASVRSEMGPAFTQHDLPAPGAQVGDTYAEAAEALLLVDRARNAWCHCP